MTHNGYSMPDPDVPLTPLAIPSADVNLIPITSFPSNNDVNLIPITSFPSNNDVNLIPNNSFSVPPDMLDVISYKENSGKPVTEYSATTIPKYNDITIPNYSEVTIPNVLPAKPALSWLKQFKMKGLVRECAAEFWGTFIMIAFGDGVVANVVLGSDLLNKECPVGHTCNAQPTGNYVTITLAWGLAVLFGVLSSANISGAHLNPAVTLSSAIFKGFPWKKVLPFWIAQTAGAFAAAGFVLSVYYQSFRAADPNYTLATAGIFCTFKRPWLDLRGALWDQIAGTALLIAGIFSIGDSRNVGLASTTGPFAVALLVVVIGMAFGLQAGYAINPARDFGPRLLAAFAGWGSQMFTAADYYFWVPIVGPLIGGPLGGLMYILFIEQHYPLELPTQS